MSIAIPNYTSPPPSQHPECCPQSDSMQTSTAFPFSEVTHTISPYEHHTQNNEIDSTHSYPNDMKSDIYSEITDPYNTTHTQPVDVNGYVKEGQKSAEISDEFTHTEVNDGHTIVKLLVSHVVAGIIIGKNGQEINSLQLSHNINIRLSASREYFPGTTDRVVLISGPRNSVMEAIDYVLMRVREEAIDYSVCNTRVVCEKIHINLKMIVPNSAVGVLIGKGGSQVKELQENSGCKIYINRDINERSKMKERVCHIIGAEQQVREAIISILDLLQGDTRSELTETVSYPNLSDSYIYNPINSSKNNGKNLLNLAMSLTKRPDILNYNNSIDMMIPAVYAGGIIGPNGKSVTEIQNLTHTSIQMSPKDHQETNSGNRRLSITGPLCGVLEAYILIVDKMIQMQQNNSRNDNSSTHSENFSYSCPIPNTQTSYNNFYQPPCNVARSINQNFINSFGITDQPFNFSVRHPLNYYLNTRNYPFTNFPSTYSGYMGQPEAMIMHPSQQVGYETDYMASHGMGYWNM